MRDSAFIPYKSWGKTAHIHSGLNHSSGLRPPGQASSRHLDNQHYRQRLTTEVTQRSGQTYLVYQALALLRGKSRWAASQCHGVCSPLNLVSYINHPPPGATCIGVTAFVCYYSLYLLLLLLVTSPRIYLYYCSSEYQLLSSHHPRFDSYQVLLVGGSFIYPIVASATTWPPQGHYIRDPGGSRTPGLLHWFAAVRYWKPRITILGIQRVCQNA